MAAHEFLMSSQITKSKKVTEGKRKGKRYPDMLECVLQVIWKNIKTLSFFSQTEDLT